MIRSDYNMQCMVQFALRCNLSTANVLQVSLWIVKHCTSPLITNT